MAIAGADAWATAKEPLPTLQFAQKKAAPVVPAPHQRKAALRRYADLASGGRSVSSWA
jgi:hypothetical protein